MNTKMFSIYDTAIQAYMRPFFAQSAGQAVRMFEDLVMDPQHEINRHAEDYTLWQLGEFDDQDASYKVEKIPLGTALEIKSAKNEQAIRNNEDK